MIARSRLIPFSLSLLLLQHSFALAATHHVSAGANAGSADGSAAHPWATLAHAATQLTTGDTLVVGAGTYPETVVFATSGVTIEAAAGAVAIIDGGGTLPGSYTGLVELAGSNIIFSGLQVQNSSAMGILSSGNNNTIQNCLTQGHHYYGIRYANVDGGLVQNNEVTGNVVANANLGGLGAGCLLIQESTNIKVINNIIYENYGFGTSLVEGQGHVFSGNIVYDDVTFGVAAIATKDVTITGNFFYDTGNPAFHEDGTPMTGPNLELIDVTNPAVQSNIITNNIIANCEIGIIWAVPDEADGMNGTLIANNTIVDPKEAAIYLDEMATLHANSTFANNIIRSSNPSFFFVTEGITFLNNNWSGSSAPAGAASPDDVHGYCPLVDISTDTPESFKLVSIPGGTVCQNAGAPLAGVPTDFFGTPRPIEANYDVGAHEAEPAPPLPPDQGIPDTGPDAGVPDTGVVVDQGQQPDQGDSKDAKPKADSSADSGTDGDDGGCGCGVSSAAEVPGCVLLLAFFGAPLLLRRARRKKQQRFQR